MTRGPTRELPTKEINKTIAILCLTSESLLAPERRRLAQVPGLAFDPGMPDSDDASGAKQGRMANGRGMG